MEIRKLYKRFVDRFGWNTIFIGFLVMAVWYLIAHRGVWEFTDSGFFYRSLDQAFRMAWSKLYVFSNTDGFSLGFDNASRSFAHLLVSWYQWVLILIFGSDIGQTVYYVIYYTICFFFGQRLIRSLVPVIERKTLKVAALLIAFNPFSLLIITLFATGYVYACTIVLFDSVLRYVRSGKKSHLLLATISAVYTLTYLRLVPLLFVLAVSIIIIFKVRFESIRRMLILCGTVVLCSMPFLVGTVMAFTQSDNIVNNYQAGFAKYDLANYSFKKSFTYSLSFPGGFTPSAISFVYNPRGLAGFADNFSNLTIPQYYTIVQIVGIGVLLVLSIYYGKKDRRLYTIAGLCLGVIAINTSGFFLSFSSFQLLHKTVLVFLYNDYGFIQFIEAFLLLFAFIFISPLVKESQKKFLYTGIVVFLFINLTPFLTNAYGLQKIKAIPQEYKNTLITDTRIESTETSLFTPYHWVKFNWAPYFLDMNFFGFSKYQSLITPNLRIVGGQFTNFFNGMYSQLDNPNFPNTALFNVKNIFAFHDVQTSNDTIDTYKVNDLEKIAAVYSRSLAARSDLVVTESNDRFVQYRFSDADASDHLLYLAGKIMPLPIENFYDKPLTFSDNPVVVDDARALALIDSSNVSSIAASSTTSLSYKYSMYDPTVYFVKISGLNLATREELLQLNQTFNSSWKAYFLDKTIWDGVACSGQSEKHVLTKNENCLYKPSFLQTRTLKSLGAPSLSGAFHIRSNYVGNGFLLNNNSVPQELRDDDELYIMLFFQKQLYYQISLVISAISILVTFVCAIGELMQTKINRKSL